MSSDAALNVDFTSQPHLLVAAFMPGIGKSTSKICGMLSSRLCNPLISDSQSLRRPRLFSNSAGGVYSVLRSISQPFSNSIVTTK